MTENEIRPDHLMQGQAERYANDVRRLLSYKEGFVRVPCPACGCSEAAEAFRKFEMTYETCTHCGTLYVNPRPTPEILEIYYRTSENYAYWNQFIFPASEASRREKIFRPRVARLRKICDRYESARNSLLEVGAGFGTFCEEVIAAELFRRVLAVEPTPDLAQTCRKKGLDVIEKPIELVSFAGETFDAVVSFEVIEHLFAPGDFIHHCAQALNPGGLLVLTCPNCKGFDIVVLQALSGTVDTEHLNYFHPASLSTLVKESGLDVLEVTTPGELDAELVRKRILSKEFDASGQPFLMQVLIDEWERIGGQFQGFLAENMLSSHMWLVARKPRHLRFPRREQ
jgi:2-polyprenyl-3-methyl-5-hydroxy-6-metoxy-1,4-benzoquinol methylase